MSVPQRRALEIRQGYELGAPPSDDEVAAVCEAEGLTVLFDVPELVGRVREVLIDDCLCLARGLDRRERRWLMAHGLGHWLMHEPGGHFYLRDRQIGRDRQEWQAELFAGWLLCCDGPIAPLGRIVRDGISGLAEWAEVPYQSAHLWAGMVLPQLEWVGQ